VAVPFPFTERLGEKKRPALVLSRKPFNRAEHTVLAMITSAAHRRWPGDVNLAHWEATGLRGVPGPAKGVHPGQPAHYPKDRLAVTG